MILQIKRGNRVIAESADFSYSPSLQEVRKLTCEVVSVVPIEFKAYNSKSESEYDTVVYNGNTFILYQAPSGDNLNEAGKYKYSLLFYGKEVLLQNVAFLDIVSGTGGEINKIRYTHGGLFQFWGDAKQLAARIEANIESYNASLGAGYTGIGTWTLNVDAEGELTEDMIDITDGTNLFEALKNFYDKFYLNYYFSTTANGGIITITDKTRPSVNWTFKQGDGGGAVKVSSSVDTSTPVITRIIPQGGSRNVPPEYKKDAKPADESRYCPYILLPNDSDGNIRYYIDSEYGLKNYGVRGKTISNTFSGIYPSIRGKKLGDLYPSGLPEWDTYKADGEPDPQSGKVAGEGASASTRIDKIIGSTPIKSDDSDSFFIYMTSPGFNLGYKVYEDGDSSDKINDNVQPQYKPHAMFDKYRDFESFDIYGTRAYYDQPVKVTATFSGKMLFSILPIGSDAVGKKVKINLRMVLNRVLGQASPLKEVVIGEEGATGMLEIPYDKTALVGYIEKGQNTTVTIRVEFTFDSDVPAGSCKIGFSEEMTCNIHFGNQDGSQDGFYYKYASVTDAVFSMRTGTYTGTEFKINKNGIIPLYGEVNGDTGETEEDVAMFNKGARYKISCYRTDSDNAKLPLYTDGKSPSIAEGTEFVILNIVMPESYVTMAENTLEKAALDYLSRYDHENRTVSLDISSGFVAEHPNLFIDFIEGNMLKVRDDGIGVFDFSDNGQIVDMQLQIQSLEIKYSKENMFPSYSCTIARRKILSFYERLAQENQTASTQNTTNVTLGGSGTGSGTNIFSEQLLNDLIASFQKFNGWFEWDEVNQALRCKSAFYTNQWISALGAQSGSGEPGGGGSGVVNTVYSFANLTDGTTFSDSDLDNTFNAYTIKKLYDMAGQGGLDADAMWAELKKADSSKVIDISHIPTSVLDGRWVTISTNQTITGQKTFTQQLKSTVATGVSPLIVSSNTLVNNLNSNYLEGYNKFGFIHSNYSASTGGTAYVSGDTHIMLIAEIDINTIYSTYVILLSNEFWGHQHYSALQLHIACTNNDNNGNKTPRCSVNVMSRVGSHVRSVYYKVENNKAYIFIKVEGGNSYGRWASTILQNYDSITTNNANTTGNITLRFAFNQANSGLSDASYVNYISSTGLATSRTLWGQPFNGTANVSGDMTGVGNITMSGALHIGNATSPNTIYFYGTTGDSPGGYNHTFIAERIWGGTECSELVLFKGNDLGNGTDAITASNGPDRIRHIAAAHLFQTYTTVLSGSVESVCTSSALKNLFSIASNRVISYVQLQSTIASGVAPFIVASNTVVSNLNADLLDGQHLSDLDGRYVNVTGDTMTGDLTMSNTNAFNIGWGTRVVRNAGPCIHGGTDTASSTDANLRFGSWNGIGWYPTISGMFVAQGNNAMWLDVRRGALDVFNTIISHHGYLAANWDSARRLVLGGGGSYAWIDSRNSSNKVLCNIVLQDNKVVIGNYAESSRFVSTVGTGKAPYQCNSTTLNTNLNADMLDNWHLNFLPRNYNIGRCYAVKFALGGEDNGWKKIFACSESGATPYRSVTVWGRIWYAYGNHAQSEVWNYHFCAIFYMRSGPSSSDSSVGNVENSARLYLPTFAKGMDNIRLVRVGTNNFELQVRQIGLYHNANIEYQYWSYGCNVSAWENLQSTSNTSVVVSAGGASTLADSRASSADVWTTARTFYIQDHDSSHTGAGVNVNGGSNVYLKLPSSIQCSDWFRSTGNSGWYHQNYGGGIYMQDSSWVRVFGGKRFYVENGDNTDFSTATAISTSGGIYARKNITSSANIIATGAITAKASSSDIRLKTDIQDYDAMGIIRKFQSVKYHWNNLAKRNSEIFNHKKWNYGLIAQDLLSGGYSQWVSDIFKDYYTIDYERLIPVVWKGLQEVDDEVIRLKKRVRELEKRLGIN
nr:MAG: Prophage endopeptidase tail [Bacteriophage sp.]